MRSITTILKEMERVDRALEDSSLKKYEKIAELAEELEKVAKEEKRKISDIYKDTTVVKSKIDRAKRIKKVQTWLYEQQIQYERLGIGHFEDIFRIKNKFYNMGCPDEAKEEAERYISMVNDIKQNILRKEFLPPREKSSKEVAFQEFVEYLKYKLGLREKAPIITKVSDCRKIAFIVHNITRDDAKMVENLIKAITVNVRNVY